MVSADRYATDRYKDQFREAAEEILRDRGMECAPHLMAAFVEFAAELGISFLGKDLTVAAFHDAIDRILEY